MAVPNAPEFYQKPFTELAGYGPSSYSMEKPERRSKYEVLSSDLRLLKKLNRLLYKKMKMLEVQNDLIIQLVSPLCDPNTARSYYIQFIGRYQLTSPIKCSVSFDKEDQIWSLENEELALSGYGSSFYEALINLEQGFDILITGIFAFPDSELSDDSKQIKEKLKDYVNFNDFLWNKPEIIRE